MKSLTYPEFSKNLVEILKKVEFGEEVVIQHEKTHKNIAVVIPYQNYKGKQKGTTKKPSRKLGVLKGKATYKINKDFKMTDEELLNS